MRLHRSWLNATFVHPGGLVHDAQKGHAVNLEKTTSQTFLSYLDLAAGMIEVADAEGKYDWVGVSILPTSKDVKVEWRVPIFLVAGLTFHFLPWMYGISRYRRI